MPAVELWTASWQLILGATIITNPSQEARHAIGEVLPVVTLHGVRLSNALFLGAFLPSTRAQMRGDRIRTFARLAVWFTALLRPTEDTLFMRAFGSLVVLVGFLAAACSNSGQGDSDGPTEFGSGGGGSSATGSGGVSNTVSATTAIGTKAIGGATATSGVTATGGTSPDVVNTCSAAGPLKDAGNCNGKLIGAAIASGNLNNNSYVNAAKEHNFATPENEMKWDTVESSRGNFRFDTGDRVVDFAQTNNMKVKGHTLVWHSQLPNWVSSLSSADEVRTVMLNHIRTVMTHYKGKIYAWDVVNEAWETPNKNGDGTATLRKSVFYDKLGEGYIDEAFKAAKEADPDALLFYNDYSTEGMNDKSTGVYNMVKGMKERGIPIDGVGIQMHVGTPNDTPTAAEIKQNIDRIAALGLQIMISEMDINGCDGYTSDSMSKLYHDVVAACVSQPKCTAITFWGISDSGSWLNSFGEAGCNGRNANALLWDGNYQKKPTYMAVIDALTGH